MNDRNKDIDVIDGKIRKKQDEIDKNYEKLCYHRNARNGSLAVLVISALGVILCYFENVAFGSFLYPASAILGSISLIPSVFFNSSVRNLRNIDKRLRIDMSGMKSDRELLEKKELLEKEASSSKSSERLPVSQQQVPCSKHYPDNRDSHKKRILIGRRRNS